MGRTVSFMPPNFPEGYSSQPKGSEIILYIEINIGRQILFRNSVIK